MFGQVKAVTDLGYSTNKAEMISLHMESKRGRGLRDDGEEEPTVAFNPHGSRACRPATGPPARQIMHNTINKSQCNPSRRIIETQCNS